MSSPLADAVRRAAHDLGFDLVGITTAAPPDHAAQFEQWLADDYHGQMGYLARNAAKRVAPRAVLPGARSIIAVGMNYWTGVEQDSTAGRIARYAWGAADYHDLVGEKLEQLATFIRCLPIPSTQAPARAGTQALWYVDTGPVLERDLAQRAGIGFIGKHTNLISRGLGNWILLGAILTTLDVAPDPPATRTYCGICRRCLAACPTGAIVAPYRLDARRCISYLTIELKGSIPVELRPLVGDRVFGCDDCLEVCPWNRFACQSPVAAFRRRPLPPLREFVGCTAAQFRELFRGTPLLRLKRGRFLRNVSVALGNGGGPADLPALTNAARDADPLVREHAAWAIDRIRERAAAHG